MSFLGGPSRPRHRGGGVSRTGPVEVLGSAGSRSPRAACGRLDLRERDAVRAALEREKADVVVHAAAVVGGIGANRAHPAASSTENAIMGIQLIEEARARVSQKFRCLGTICAYPKFTPVPFREEDLWNGYPEETTRRTGLAKKMLLVPAPGLPAGVRLRRIYLLPVNLYGPGDNSTSRRAT